MDVSFRDTLANLFGAIPEPVPLSGKQMTNAWRTSMAIEAKEARLATRSGDFPDWDQQVLNAFGMQVRPWRWQSVSQALSVPSIFSAVTLVSNTVGSLSVETFRDGVRLEGADRPRLVTRPDPFKTPNKFYRDTAFYLATRGEAWWWVAKRDADGLPISLIVVPPWEIQVDPSIDRLRPVITWNTKGNSTVMPNEDMRQITYLPDYSTLRGLGPLQSCDAAVSTAVESEEWAATFYADGGYPSMWIKAAGSLGQLPTADADGNTEEAQVLMQQFKARTHNTPFLTDDGIEDVKEFGLNPQGAQMLEARQHNKGDTANMFRIPGVLLEYNQPGSSLTYQSIPEVFALFVRSCLSPNYLEPIEQELTDLLPRSTVARFNVSGFERADAKSRWETYAIMATVIGQQEAADLARVYEGIDPGDIEFAPVPFAPPQAFPTSLPTTRSAEAVRCTGRRVLKGMLRPCGKLLAEAGPFTGSCPRCGTVYEGALTA